MAKYTSGSSKRAGSSSPNAPLLLGIAGLIAVTLGGGYFWMSNQAVEFATDKSGCLTKRATPEAMLVLVDETDKLTKENAERIRTHIVDRVRALPRYSRVLIVPFGGDLATPLKTVFDQCVPGKGAEGGPAEGALILQKKYEEFETTLNGLVNTLQNVADSKTSPITDQVVRAASDSVLHWEGQARSLYLITDGLETTVYWTKELHLKKTTSDILRGVKAEYFEIGNSKGARYQTKELRDEWKAWLTSAGAEVRMDAPGYPAS